MPGTFSLVLHAHMPYVKKQGRWPHGEEWLYEVMADTYIPLLDTLNQLVNDGIMPKITISISPVLLEQLADAYIKEMFEEYLKERIDLAEGDVKRFQRKKEYQKLAQFYVDYYTNILESFRRYNRDLPGAFRELQDMGAIEILTSAATHAYLPLLLNDEWVYFQIKVGVETYRKFFKRRPRGIWIPEMAYRPKGHWKGPLGEEKSRRGIEEILEDLGLEFFFVDAHAIEGRRIRTLFSGGETVENDPNWIPRGSVYNSYKVKGSSVVVIGRNMETSLQVWSRDVGYPGDPWYREFHKIDNVSGMHYWRVTSKEIPLEGKKVYNPEMAMERVRVHAEHFSNLIRNLLRDKDESNIIMSPYDAELFGHWWFEGIKWIELVIRRLHDDDIVILRTISEYIDAYPPVDEIDLPESSWGYGGKHMTWWNDKTLDYWRKEYDAEKKALDLRTYIRYKNGKKRYIVQALRELLILQSSDWAFLIFTNQAPDYAEERYNKHYSRFLQLYLAVIDNKEISSNDVFSEDTVFDNEVIEDALLSI